MGCLEPQKENGCRNCGSLSLFGFGCIGLSYVTL
jgi:hypothetical protein